MAASKAKRTKAAAVKAAAEAPAVNASEVQDSGKSIVVLAWPGTEKDMERIWALYGPEGFTVRTAPELRLADLLAELIADSSVARDFVLVPANLIPVRPVTSGELAMPTEDVSPVGAVRWGRTPVRFDKDVLAELLPDLSDHIFDEDLVKEYQKHTLPGIPYQVAHHFGNYYTKVLRGNPCRHVVLEGFIRKHFIYASAEGWPAVLEVAEDTILKA